MDEVQCFLDNNFLVHYAEIHGKLVLPPERINEFEYDYVVIFNQAHASDIFNQLIGLGVNAKKIISWQYYFFYTKFNPSGLTLDCYLPLRELIKKLHIKTVLDIDNSLMRNCIGIKDRNLPLHHITTNLNSGDISRYDAVIMLDYFIYHTLIDFETLIKSFKNKARYFIFAVPYSYPAIFTKWSEYNYSKLGKIKIINCQTVKLYIVDTKIDNKCKDIKIYIVTHKKFVPPQNDIFFPLYAGKGNDNDMHIVGDASGDSISELNPLINECTALYWIWKNVDTRYIGLCHYRRYFSNGLPGGTFDSFNIPDGEYIQNVLSKKDIIVAKANFFNYMTVKSQLKNTLCPDAFDEGFKIIRRIIVEKYSEYVQDFDNFFERGHYIYPCNMFITSRNNLHAYCSWLFDIIIPAAKEIDVSKYDSYSKRVIGFFAERLFTLWILHNKKTVQEEEVLLIN